MLFPCSCCGDSGRERGRGLRFPCSEHGRSGGSSLRTRGRRGQAGAAASDHGHRAGWRWFRISTPAAPSFGSGPWVGRPACFPQRAQGARIRRGEVRRPETPAAALVLVSRAGSGCQPLMEIPPPDAPPHPHLLPQGVDKVTHYGDTATALCFRQAVFSQRALGRGTWPSKAIQRTQTRFLKGKQS